MTAEVTTRTVRDPRAVQRAIQQARAALAEAERELLASQPVVPPGLFTVTPDDVGACAALAYGDVEFSSAERLRAERALDAFAARLATRVVVAADCEHPSIDGNRCAQCGAPVVWMSGEVTLPLNCATCGHDDHGDTACGEMVRGGVRVGRNCPCGRGDTASEPTQADAPRAAADLHQAEHDEWALRELRDDVARGQSLVDAYRAYAAVVVRGWVTRPDDRPGYEGQMRGLVRAEQALREGRT